MFFSLYIKGTKKLGLCCIVLISLFQVKCTFFMVFADIRSLCKPIISYFTPIFLPLISYIF